MHPVMNGFMPDVSQNPFMLTEGSVQFQSNFPGGHNYLQNGSTVWTSQLNQFGKFETSDRRHTFGHFFISD